MPFSAAPQGAAIIGDYNMHWPQQDMWKAGRDISQNSHVGLALMQQGKSPFLMLEYQFESQLSHFQSSSLAMLLEKQI